MRGLQNIICAVALCIKENKSERIFFNFYVVFNSFISPSLRITVSIVILSTFQPRQDQVFKEIAYEINKFIPGEELQENYKESLPLPSDKVI